MLPMGPAPSHFRNRLTHSRDVLHINLAVYDRQQYRGIAGDWRSILADNMEDGRC